VPVCHYITPGDIDKLAGAGINTLHIPTTYTAWVRVPGSQLYSGNQVSFLKTIATYAITKYKIYIIIDVHLLPGGINGMPFGKASGHFGWFNNQTALDYSLEAINAMLDYVQNQSGSPSSYTIAPINGPVDDITQFGFLLALTDSGAEIYSCR
jgi:aryl-phospho-beta-D-glucosidase BglC (GH1 family)